MAAMWQRTSLLPLSAPGMYPMAWLTVPVAYALDKDEYLLPSSILSIVAKTSCT